MINHEEGKRIIFDEDFYIEQEEKLEELVLIGANGVVAGQVKSLIIIGGKVEIGEGAIITDEVAVIAADMHVNEAATVTENIASFNNPFSKSFVEAVVKSGILTSSGSGFFLLIPLLTILFTWVIGAIYYHLAPQFHERSLTYFTDQIVPSFGWGLLSYVLFLPVLIIIILTIIGILLVPFYLFLYMLGTLLAGVTAAIYITQKIPAVKEKNWNFHYNLLAGLIILQVVALIPFVGSLFNLLLTTAGFGAFLVNLVVLLQNKRKNKAENSNSENI